MGPGWQRASPREHGWRRRRAEKAYKKALELAEKAGDDDLVAAERGLAKDLVRRPVEGLIVVVRVRYVVLAS